MTVKGVSLVLHKYDTLKAVQMSLVSPDTYLGAVTLLNFEAKQVINPVPAADRLQPLGPGGETPFAHRRRSAVFEKLGGPQPAATEVNPGFAPYKPPEQVDFLSPHETEKRFRTRGRKQTSNPKEIPIPTNSVRYADRQGRRPSWRKSIQLPATDFHALVQWRSCLRGTTRCTQIE